MKIKTSIKPLIRKALPSWGKACGAIVLLVATLASCARMGQPDGGWYDETPPKVIGASPSDGGVGVNSRKIEIFFDEFIKVDNPTEKVVVSPPQLEAPEIKSAGRKIAIELKDSLKANTTYTIDFSDAISDNNEGNPLGNYSYCFSTGNQIDTLEVSGNVLAAENLEPVKGILVGLYKVPSADADKAAGDLFTTMPMMRVARTDSRGHFEIKGIAPGTYNVYALKDADGDYKFGQKSETVAFLQEAVTPSAKPDVRQDTLWTDSVHINAINRVGYTHFFPDNIVLRAFTETLTDRFFLKCERKEPDHFTMFFSYGSDELPKVRGLNFDDKDAFVIESSAKRDTVTYWLRDTALVNRDSLSIEMQYMMSDSTGTLISKTDTLNVMPTLSYAKRMKLLEKKIEDWKKQQDKAKKKGERYDSVMPPEPLTADIKAAPMLDPDKNISFDFPAPIAKVDTTKIHLYAHHDSLWYVAPFEFRQRLLKSQQGDSLVSITNNRYCELLGEWRPGIEYSLEIDSAAFVDIYGKASLRFKQGFKVKTADEYSTLMFNVAGMSGQSIVVQLLDAQDKPVKQVSTTNGHAEFFYIEPGKYYVRMFVDNNGNEIWDTGNYAAGRQPEEVFYYPTFLECKAKWDMNETWNPRATELSKQKPSAITVQKPDREKKVRLRNAERARKMGIDYITNLNK